MALFLPLALATLMFTVGLRLSFSHFSRMASQPVPLLIGLALQMLGLPLLAWAIVRVLHLPPDLALGLMIIAVSPGGITSNYVTLLAGADVVLSTSMTLITSLAASISIPLLLRLSGIEIPATSLLHMSAVMTAVTAVPLLFGMSMRRATAKAAARLEMLLDKPSKLIFAVIVITTFWQNRAALAESAMVVGPTIILLNGLIVLAGLSTRRISSVSRSQSLAIAIETGLQNAAIAIFLATAILDRAELAVPALIYAVIMNVTALAIVFSAKFVPYGQRKEACQPEATR